MLHCRVNRQPTGDGGDNAMLIGIHITLSPENSDHHDAIMKRLRANNIDVAATANQPWISIEGQIDEKDLDAIITKIIPPIDRSR
jgi:hypothetical protein